jgi:hypothetical protein
MFRLEDSRYLKSAYQFCVKIPLIAKQLIERISLTLSIGRIALK